jgi:hypothetical protein
MSTNSETMATAAAKLSPPVTVSLANIGGYQVSEVVMIVTLIYTIALLIHKLWQMFTDVCDRMERKRRPQFDRRRGEPDERPVKLERRFVDRRMGE